MPRHLIGSVDDIPPGGRKIVRVNGREIGVFNVEGTFYALRNICPHQGAPLCLGTVGGAASPSEPGEYIWVRKGEVLRCPWHGWEFDLCTGKTLFDERIRVKTFRIEVEEDRLILITQAREKPV